MSVTRIVPNLAVTDVAQANALYAQTLGLPTISVGVAAPAEVDAIYERVVAAGLEVVHPLTDENWGVHRFFFRDHDGNVVNVVAHN